MKFRKSLIKRWLVNFLTVFLAVFWIFPILWMFVSSFKPEAKVVLLTLNTSYTLANYNAVISSDFFHSLFNSITISVATVILSSILGVVAAYALVFTPLKNPNSIYFWFVSTTFLPAVGVIIPVYLSFNRLGLVDTRTALVLLYIGMGVPLMVWLTTGFFKELPKEIVEAADIDGSSRFHTFFAILIPLVRNGIVSAALLVFVTTWNEFFFGVTISYTNAITLPVYMSRYMTQEGFFWGKMCAISCLIVLIPIVIGFATQKTLAKGLTAGSVKG